MKKGRRRRIKRRMRRRRRRKEGEEEARCGRSGKEVKTDIHEYYDEVTEGGGGAVV